MPSIDEWIKGCVRIGITGHIRPDGDCMGACTALYRYIMDTCTDVVVDVHLESVPTRFNYLSGTEYIDYEYVDEKPYDIFFVLDCGDIDRIGQAIKYFKKAKKTISIDHHISNTGYAEENILEPDSSSTSEVLYGLLDDKKVSLETAISLFTGIIHDTGMLKHSNVSEKTMCIAGKLISKGVPFSKIIDESFYQKTFMQNQLLGKSLIDSVLALDGKCIISVLDQAVMDYYGAVSSDLEGIIDQLRVTKGVEVAMLLHETNESEYKVSLRSNGKVNVSKIALHFGGGGHIKASGCTMKGNINDILTNLTDEISKQFINIER